MATGTRILNRHPLTAAIVAATVLATPIAAADSSGDEAMPQGVRGIQTAASYEQDILEAMGDRTLIGRNPLNNNQPCSVQVSESGRAFEYRYDGDPHTHTLHFTDLQYLPGEPLLVYETERDIACILEGCMQDRTVIALDQDLQVVAIHDYSRKMGLIGGFWRRKDLQAACVDFQ